MRFARSAIALVVAADFALQGVALAAPFASNLALKVTYDLLYRNQPLPGLEKLDTTFGVGVQATF